MNIRGTFNVFEAAAGGLPPSSSPPAPHAIGFYRVGQQIGTDVPVRPDTYWGVSKVFGEGLGSLLSRPPRHGGRLPAHRRLSGRAGEPRHLWVWLSHRDAVQLVKRSLEAPEVGFLTVYGVSANRRSWWRRDGWETIGNAPVDDAEAFASRIGDQQP